jgi:hypothetical protein
MAISKTGSFGLFLMEYSNAKWDQAKDLSLCHSVRESIASEVSSDKE